MTESKATHVADPVIAPPNLSSVIESILMVATEPASSDDIADAIGVDAKTVDCAIRALKYSYDGEDSAHPRHGFELREIAGGWRMYSRPEHAQIVQRFVLGEKTSRLSQAALETLAVVAYRQPVTRSQIAAIRGVSVDGVIRTLSARGLIEEVGSTDTGAIHYGTTREFLEVFGLRNLSELPKMAPNYPSAEQLPEVMEEIESLRR